MKYGYKASLDILISLMACLLLALCAGSVNAATDNKLLTILAEIEKLENNSDPKCYATASRLEDFMFGTPLSDNARFSKNLLQKKWLLSIWSQASRLAVSQGQQRVEQADVRQVIKPIMRFDKNTKGHWQLTFREGKQLQIHQDDKRQYASIAYSLRTLLAVQQESLLTMPQGQQDDNLPLSKSAVSALTDALDLATLSVLKVADQQARSNNQFEIDKISLSSLWQGLLSHQGANNAAQVTASSARSQVLLKSVVPREPVELTLLTSLVEQKVRSYAVYNEISNQLFVRNLQVFFARSRWPQEPSVALEFRRLFTETVIAFAADFYRGAEQIALDKGHTLIQEQDISEFAQRIIPHQINQYEDAIFFHRLAKNEQVTIESYDMDAFRDSGIHWRYLQYAVLAPEFTAYLEPDPFASELLVENIAQFGVLVLRLTGEMGRAAGLKQLALEHFKQAMAQIQLRVTKHGRSKPVQQALKAGLSSSNSQTTAKQPQAEPEPGASEVLFSNITASSGIDFMHRSSDWLNRLLRSYLKKDEYNGVITIPPAFGGSGLAAQDINNDGLADLLMLSGLGNKLYINRGNGKFSDISKSAGLSWIRAIDRQPGEPRQPLIADLDNDGLQDIVITYVNDQHRVYKNLGNETFQDMTPISQLGGVNLVGGPATVFDFDNDGLLDIYITYFGDYIHGILPSLKRRNDNGLANRLFRNLGNFKFEDVTMGSGLDHTGWGQAVTHTDLDNDGLQDLIVGNDFGVNAYFKNLGGGKFSDISARIGTDKPSYTMGIGTADLNDDLLPDIYISNIVTMNKDEKYVLPDQSTTMKFNPDKLASMRVIEANDLFLSVAPAVSDDQALISYQASQAVGRGYSSTGWSWDADFFDYDNDGDDDLYVLNGMNEYNLYGNDNPYYTDPIENKPVDVYIPVATKESNVFFSNDNGRLNNVSRQSGADLLANSRSAVYLDLDSDGDLDMVLNNYHEKAVVYRNNAEKLGRNWLKIKLFGAPQHGVNLDAIGAQIIVSAKQAEQDQQIWRTVQGSTGYMSVHPKEQHFGLDQIPKVNVLVKWPNGRQTRLQDIKVNQTLTIRYNQHSLVQTSDNKVTMVKQ
jgi:hypothetical protein